MDDDGKNLNSVTYQNAQNLKYGNILDTKTKIRIKLHVGYVSIHLFYLHNKYCITLLNLNRNICVILIVNMMDEGLKRCSFDCGVAL